MWLLQQLLKAEHELRLENYNKSVEHSNVVGATPRRNALAANQPKSLRGGGGMARSFNDPSTSQVHRAGSGEDPLSSIPEIDGLHIHTSSNSAGDHHHHHHHKSGSSGRRVVDTIDEDDSDEEVRPPGGILKGPVGQSPATSKSSVFSRMLKNPKK